MLVARSDPKFSSGIANGLNEYVALNNNPVNFVDPTGESAIEAADYWASMAGSGYNQGGFAGWWKVQTGNTMGMFINMWHAQEMEEHAGLAGEYWDECKGKSAKHMAIVGGYALQDYLQFAALAKMGQMLNRGSGLGWKSDPPHKGMGPHDHYGPKYPGSDHPQYHFGPQNPPGSGGQWPGWGEWWRGGHPWRWK